MGIRYDILLKWSVWSQAWGTSGNAAVLDEIYTGTTKSTGAFKDNLKPVIQPTLMDFVRPSEKRLCVSGCTV